MYDEMITALVEQDGNQLSSAEYRYVATRMAELAGCNVLVFGAGNDSALWLHANRGGRTVFLESSFHWTQRVKLKHPEADVRAVSYGTRQSEWQDLLRGPASALYLALPADICDTVWDVIFVDAPAGYNASCPGRMKSIATAAMLARRGGRSHVIVHDCDRMVEQRYCDAFFSPADLLRAFERTRHYVIGSAA